MSWYEAAAYAEFVGKSLPTAYYWTWASQATWFPGVIASTGNFLGDGTQPVGSPDALSGFGTTDMAGNVKEWCWNEGGGGKRLLLGGEATASWPTCSFKRTRSFPGIAVRTSDFGA